jgi:hypothetical protein
MLDSTKKGVIVALFLFILGAALTGQPAPPTPANAYLNTTCHDTIDNDVDSQTGQFPIPVIDIGDSECLWMPYDFWFGEYDGQGLFDPPPSEVAAYVSTWQTNYSHYPTAWAGIKALFDQYGQTVADACNDGRAQPILTEYRDNYGLPDSMTGVSLHQSECGVSY